MEFSVALSMRIPARFGFDSWGFRESLGFGVVSGNLGSPKAFAQTDTSVLIQLLPTALVSSPGCC